VNILYVSPSNVIGGAEISLLAMVRYFKGRSCRVYVALPGADNNSYEELLSPHVDGTLHVKSMGWHSAPCATPLFARVKRFLYFAWKSRGWHVAPCLAIYRYIKSQRINLVHTNTMFSIDGALAAKFAGVPHIQHVRELIGSGDHSLARFPLMNSPLFRKCMTFLHAKVVVNSKFTGQTCENYFEQDDLVQIYNPLAEEQFFPQEELRKKCFEGTITIGLVANVTARFKRHLLFIEAARVFTKKYPSRAVRFNIYGNLPPENDPYLHSLRERIHSYGLEDCVHLKGQYTKAVEIFRELNFLIHTYPWESFGRVYLEAMAHGVPVIAVEGGGVIELIQSGKTGFLVKDGLPEALASNIEWLLTHPSERQDIIENAYRFALDFKGEKIMPKIESLYQEVLRSSAA
jgi:glycosyltransferase involved in cell wall biosynthesis